MSWSPSTELQRLIVAVSYIVICAFLLSQPDGFTKLTQFVAVTGPIIGFYFGHSPAVSIYMSSGTKAFTVASILLAFGFAAGCVWTYHIYGLTWIPLLFSGCFIVTAVVALATLLFGK